MKSIKIEKYFYKFIIILFIFVAPLLGIAEEGISKTNFCKDAATTAQFCYDCYNDGHDSNIEDIKNIAQQVLAVNLSEEAQYIVDGMTEIANCPERLWPGLILNERPYIILDKKNQASIVVSHRYCGVPSYRVPKPTEFTKDHINTEGFSVTSINSNRAIVIPVNFPQPPIPPDLSPEIKERIELMAKERKTDRFNLLVHEAFHNCDQVHPSWKKTDSMAKRFGNDDDCTPRKYRAHMKYYLEKALKEETNSKEYNTALRQAAYWNKKYINEFPEELELTNALDAIEGSAEFVGNMAVVLKTKGCRATDKELQEGFSDHYFHKMTLMEKLSLKPPSKILPAELETYFIGSLSSALLTRVSSPEWQKKIKNNTSPTQLLLKDVSPLQTAEISGIKEGCVSIENAAKARKFGLDNINTTLNSEDYIALSVTFTKETQKTSMNFTEGVSKGIDKGYDRAKLNLSTILNTGPSNIILNGMQMLTPENSKNKCGDSQVVVLVPKSSLSVRKGNSVSQINFSGEKDFIDNQTGEKSKMDFSLEGHVKITERIEQNGADIWCAQ